MSLPILVFPCFFLFIINPGIAVIPANPGHFENGEESRIDERNVLRITDAHEENNIKYFVLKMMLCKGSCEERKIKNTIDDINVDRDKISFEKQQNFPKIEKFKMMKKNRSIEIEKLKSEDSLYGSVNSINGSQITGVLTKELFNNFVVESRKRGRINNIKCLAKKRMTLSRSHLPIKWPNNDALQMIKDYSNIHVNHNKRINKSNRNFIQQKNNKHVNKNSKANTHSYNKNKNYFFLRNTRSNLKKNSKYSISSTQITSNRTSKASQNNTTIKNIEPKSSTKDLKIINIKENCKTKNCVTEMYRENKDATENFKSKKYVTKAFKSNNDVIEAFKMRTNPTKAFKARTDSTKAFKVRPVLLVQGGVMKVVQGWLCPCLSCIMLGANSIVCLVLTTKVMWKNLYNLVL